MDHPQARTEGLVSERMDDDLLVVDGRTGAAHALSAVVTRVFELCDGTADAAQIAATSGLDPAVVQQAIAELAECGLLQTVPRVSRRELTRRLIGTGAAALATPLIYSVAINPALAAAYAPLCKSNCADYVPIAAGDCTSAGSHGVSGPAAPGVCQSGTCYQTVSGTFQCAPANCVDYGLLNCTPQAGYPGDTPCCSEPSACMYVTPESAYGCYS
jgi:hypothetical protein